MIKNDFSRGRELLLLIPLLLIFPLVYAKETKILSYNVWCDDASGLSYRYQEITDFLAKEDPDYVCLQEVTPQYLDLLRKKFSAKYRIYDDSLAKKPYGNLIFTKNGPARVQILHLETRMDRTALILEDNNYSIVNVHLESMLTDTDIRIRKQQLFQIISHTQTFPHLIICGDFNFGDAERENEWISEFTDTGKDSGEPTYDIEHNKLAAKNRFPDEPTRRLDKILLRKPTILLRKGQPTFRLEVKKPMFSDHYPIVLTVSEH